MATSTTRRFRKACAALLLPGARFSRWENQVRHPFEPFGRRSCPGEKPSCSRKTPSISTLPISRCSRSRLVRSKLCGKAASRPSASRLPTAMASSFTCTKRRSSPQNSISAASPPRARPATASRWRLQRRHRTRRFRPQQHRHPRLSLGAARAAEAHYDRLARSLRQRFSPLFRARALQQSSLVAGRQANRLHRCYGFEQRHLGKGPRSRYSHPPYFFGRTPGLGHLDTRQQVHPVQRNRW